MDGGEAVLTVNSVVLCRGMAPPVLRPELQAQMKGWLFCNFFAIMEARE